LAIPSISGKSDAPGSVHVTDRRIPALDGVRGLAILIVLIHNASWILGPSDHLVMKLLLTATASGWVGVQLFFVLSGFLITGILLDTRASDSYFRSFYTRRVLRIFPLYYAFLVGAFLLFPVVAEPEWISSARQNQLWYWTYLANWTQGMGRGVQGLSHLWSLAVEEQFYLVWPLIVFACSRQMLRRVCLVVIFLTPLIRLGLRTATGLPPNAAYAFTVARWDALAGGALLAILLGQASQSSKRLPRADSLALGAIATLATVTLIARGFPEDDPLVQVVGQTMTVVLFSWVVFVAAAARTPMHASVASLLRARWLRFLGKYSYAIYVFHFPVHIIAWMYLRDAVNGEDNLWRIVRWAGYVSAVSLVSILLAMASWNLLEKHFLNLKERLAPRGAAASA